MSGHRTQGGARKRASTRANRRAESNTPTRGAELKRFSDPVPDALVLAGVQRADLHWVRPEEGAVMSEIAHHLGYEHKAWTTRNLRPQLERLTNEGLINARCVRSVRRWSITPKGRRRLAMARRGEAVELPESPQHRQWRHAREKAAERVGEMRALFDEALTEGGRLLDQDAPASLELLILADRLKHTGWQLGSALYCLNEWEEPSDAHADHETNVMGSVMRGRRHVGSWMDRDELDERRQRQRTHDAST